MTAPHRPHRRGLLAGIRASFLTGLVIVAPAALTVWLIVTVVEFVDGTVLPLVPAWLWPEALTGLPLPGLGLIIFLAFTLAVGWLTKNIVGRSVIRWGEELVARMPVVRSIYNGLKQIAETVFSQSSNSFSRACLVEFPRPGCWAVAFVSSTARGEVASRIATERTMISVFMPTTPNPTTGFLFFVPEADVHMLDMSIEDAAKLIISAGLVVPERLPDGRLVARAAG
jgi:uncharacterized membrane protein